MSTLTRRHTLALSMCAPILAARKENWPEFRGSGNSLSSNRDLPIRWAIDRNVAWSVPLTGYGQSSPVVWDDRIFLTSIEGPEKEKLYISCFSTRDGRKLWQREFAATQRVKNSNMVSKGAPTPVVDKSRVYAFFESGDLLALDHSGEVIWSRKLTAEYGPFDGNHGVGSSLRLTDKSLLVLATHSGPCYLLSLDRRNGQNIWKADRRKAVAWSTPVILRHGGQEVIIVSANGSLEGYRAGSGEQLWQVEGIKGNLLASPTIAGDIIVVPSGDKGATIALRVSADLASQPETLWRAENASAYFNSPLIQDGLVYMVNKAGVAFCLDLKTGTERWFTRVGECWASPVGVGGRVYFFTASGKTVVFRASAQMENLASNDLPDSGRLYGVAVSGSAFFLRFGSTLVKVSS